MAKRKKIGDILVEAGAITVDQLDKGLERQKTQKGKIGKILTELGFLDETLLMNHLAMQLHVPFIELKYFEIKQDIIRELPEGLARKFRAVPLDKMGGGYMVGMADPSDLIAFDAIARKLKGNIRPALVRESDVLKTIDQVYRRTDEIANFATEIAEEVDLYSLDDDEGTDAGKNAAVNRLIETIFEDAVQVGASDIHIEPDKDLLRIRMRIDGMLQEQIMHEKQIAQAIVLRIKLMSKLNISERRLPQDGRFSLIIKGQRWDVRVSTMPVQYGESVVMRLLDQSGGQLSLDEVGIPDDILEVIKRNIHRPHGMILVTGPTGSGKSTTLYGCLSELNKAEAKIITVEDPVEYQVSRINQVQVQPKIGLTFARVLKACLRQDPDVVMVGEIRDEETATIALRAALTGHMVMSTLHTNDAVSAAVRLLDMGIEPFLAATAIRLVIAQRLVRKICTNCIESYQPSDKELSLLKSLMKEDVSGGNFKRGFGCPQCQKSGYRGRVGVYELVEFDATLTEALRSGDTEGFMKAAREKEGFKSLGQAVLSYAMEGKTGIDEVFRLAGDLEADNEVAEMAIEMVESVSQGSSPESQ